MKHVQKGNEPLVFSDWKALANEDWQPTYDDLAGEIKQAVKTELMQEQGYLCCYCECRIDADDSHIEHFRPQSRVDVDPLDFGNLLCSCQNQLQKGVPRHCGNLKGYWFIQELLVSPFDPGCESRFAFTGDGGIKPMDDTDIGAAETIKRLGLDLPKLNAMRASAIEPFLEESLSADELQQFVSGYLRQDNSGRFGEFWTTIRYLFGEAVVA
jgi:uncharacterized protein (TIGR02646 family)